MRVKLRAWFSLCLNKTKLFSVAFECRELPPDNIILIIFTTNIQPYSWSAVGSSLVCLQLWTGCAQLLSGVYLTPMSQPGSKLMCTTTSSPVKEKKGLDGHGERKKLAPNEVQACELQSLIMLSTVPWVRYLYRNPDKPLEGRTSSPMPG